MTELCCSSRTDTSSRSHHSSGVSHQKQQAGRHRDGRTATVECISCFCSTKSTPLQPHYWGKEGPGITQKRPQNPHLVGRRGRCTVVLNSADSQTEVTDLLIDGNTYKTVRQNPTNCCKKTEKDKSFSGHYTIDCTLGKPSHVSMDCPRYTRKEHHSDPSSAASTRLPKTYPST